MNLEKVAQDALANTIGLRPDTPVMEGVTAGEMAQLCLAYLAVRRSEVGAAPEGEEEGTHGEFRMGVDPEGMVVLEFERPVSWLRLDTATAAGVGGKMVEMAREAAATLN